MVRKPRRPPPACVRRRSRRPALRTSSRRLSASSGWSWPARRRREEIGLQLAEHDVGVGDRQRPAAPVAGGAGIGAGRIRADAEAARLEMEDRAAAGRDRVDAHHRRAHAHAGDLGLEGALVGAVIVGDVGRGAAHVEADDLVEAGELGRLGHADDAAGRAGQDRVLALEAVGGGEAAGGHHEDQAGAWSSRGPSRRACRRTPRAARAISARGRGQAPRHLLDIARQDRRQIGVDDRRVAAPDELHQRRHLVAGGDLREADLAAEACDGLLMLGILQACMKTMATASMPSARACVDRGCRRQIGRASRPCRRRARARRPRRPARKAARAG